MEDPLTTFINIFLVFSLVLMNGFFVAAEFAIVRAQRTKLRSEEHRRKYGWKSSLRLLSDLELSLSSTQLGITIASLILGWWGEHTLAAIFMHWFAALGDSWATILSHGVATAIALIIVTFLHVVLGELAAKSVAIRYPESTLRYLALPMLIFTQVCRPIIASLNGCASLVLRAFGLTGSADHDRVHSSAELAMLVSHSFEKGELDKDEEQMLKGIFGFSDTVAREVMTPRIDLVTVDQGASFEEVISLLVGHGFSRLPVRDKSVDNVVGILLARDVLQYANGNSENFDVRAAMREPYFIPETKPIDDLLNEFKGRKLHMAIVLDEHGGVDGVVTLEDLIEEIVGEIFDESDIPERDIIVQEDGELLVDGGVLVSDINTRFSLDIPEGDYDTIAGFMFSALGRIPQRGDRIKVKSNGECYINGHETGQQQEAEPSEEPANSDFVEVKTNAVITVEKVDSHRIESVRLKCLSQLDNSESDSSEPASQDKEIASE